MWQRRSSGRLACHSAGGRMSVCWSGVHQAGCQLCFWDNVPAVIESNKVGLVLSFVLI